MEELFKNKTECTQKEYEKFMSVQDKEGAVSELLYTLFNFGVFSICMVVAFLNKEYLLSLAILLGLTVYAWYKFVWNKKRVEKAKNNKNLIKGYINIYTFYKHFFKVENPEGNAQILYVKIKKVIETQTHYYIYISKECAFIVDKEGFINSKSEDFKKFIINKVKIGYKKLA